MRCRVCVAMLAGIATCPGGEAARVRNEPSRTAYEEAFFAKLSTLQVAGKGMTRNDDGRQLLIWHSADASKLQKIGGQRLVVFLLSLFELVCLGFLWSALLGPDSSEITEALDQGAWSWSHCFPISLDNPAVQHLT